MIRENQKVLNRMNVLTDAAVIILSVALAYWVRFVVFEGESGHIPLTYYIQASLFFTPFLLVLYSSFGLYDSFRNKNFSSEFSLILKADLIGTIVIIAVFFVFEVVNISRWVLVIFFLISTLLVALKRLFLRRLLRTYREKGFNQKRVVIIGNGPLAKEYLAVIQRDKSLGYLVTGSVSKGKLTGTPRLGDIPELTKVLDENQPDEVVAALEIEDYRFMTDVIHACEKAGSKLSIIPFYSKYMPAHPYIDEVDGIPLVNIRRIPLDNIVNALMKRLMDIIGALVLILLSSPFMLLAAIGIKLTSPGPVIFRQTRVGLGKKSFTMYKFRSMRVNNEQSSAWSTNTDPRKTKFGSFLRKFSIDELPQFFNVLKGDMSLVGPRPELPYFVDQFKESVPLYMVKHQVRPGITGWAQVSGFRGDTSIPKRIEHDIYYIENWSMIFDIKILLMTLFRGLVNQEKMVRNGQTN